MTALHVAVPLIHCIGNPRRPSSVLYKEFKGIKMKEQGYKPCFAASQGSGPRRSNATSKKKPPGKNAGKTAVMGTLESSKPPIGKKAKEAFRRRSGDPELFDLDDLPLPEPPAGFVLDTSGRVVLMASPEKRTTVIVDPANQRPLECMIRRMFFSSQGDECYLLCPLDAPLQILKIGENEVLCGLNDQEIEEVIPSAAYALAKRHMHLVLSGFCFTARGGFCYSEEDIIELDTEYDQGLGGSLAEGVEITSFQVEGTKFLIYSPFDPLLFVAAKDENGELRIAEDDLLDDSSVLDAIDEEKEFQALVEEEAVVTQPLEEE